MKRNVKRCRFESWIKQSRKQQGQKNPRTPNVNVWKELTADQPKQGQGAGVWKPKNMKKKHEDSKTKLMHLKILGSFYGSQKQEGNTGNENRRRADAPDEAVIEIIISGILFL